jgi:hypothetical protein
MPVGRFEIASWILRFIAESALGAAEASGVGIANSLDAGSRSEYVGIEPTGSLSGSLEPMPNMPFKD